MSTPPDSNPNPFLSGLIAELPPEDRYRLLEAVANHSTDGVAIIRNENPADREGRRIVYINPAFTALTGYTRAEAIGRSPRFLLGPRSDTGELQRLAEALSTAEPVRIEMLEYTKAGAEFWCDSHIFPVKEVSGEVPYFVAILRDVTELRRLEGVGARAKADVALALRSKGETLAVVGHELRAPLNALTGFVDLLFDARLAPDQRDYLETVRSCGVEMLRVVNDLLDLSKIESGRSEAVALPFDPAALLRGFLDSLAPEIARRRLRIDLRIDPALPGHVVGDGDRVRKLLEETIGGAMKALDGGRIEIRVGPRAQADAAAAGRGRRLHLEYRIAEIRGEPASPQAGEIPAGRPHSVSGVGLLLARRLCEAMGGEIEVGPEGVSGFWVAVGERERGGAAIPAPTASASEGVPGANPRSPDVPAPSPLSILIVEDNPVNQKLLVALLKRLGYVADLADHGGEAVEALRRKAYDLIFMDVQMPVMDGFECTRRIRAGECGPHHLAIPVIAVTAGALRGDRERCLEAGMNDYLSKPVSSQNLQSVLDRFKAQKAQKA